MSTTLPDKGEPSHALTMIDPDTGPVAGSAPVTGPVDGLALSPDGSRAYLVGGPELRVLDTAAGRLLVSVALGADGQDVAVAPGGRQRAGHLQHRAEGLRCARDALQHTIGLRDDPTALAITPDGSRALVLTSRTEALATVDLATRTVTGAIGVGDSPADVAVTPDGAQALVTNATPARSRAQPGRRDPVHGPVGDRPSGAGGQPGRHLRAGHTSANVVRLERVPREQVAAGHRRAGAGHRGLRDTGAAGGRRHGGGRTAVPVVLDPVVPGWSPVRSVKRAAVYDVPPNWRVHTESTIVGYETDGGHQVAASGAAVFGLGACGDQHAPLATAGSSTTPAPTWPGRRVDRTGVGRPGLPRRPRRRPPKLTVGAPEPVTTLTGRPAVVVKVTARTASRAGPCKLAEGTVHALSATGFTGELGPTAILVVVASLGQPDAVAESEIRQILGTLRPV